MKQPETQVTKRIEHFNTTFLIQLHRQTTPTWRQPDVKATKPAPSQITKENKNHGPINKHLTLSDAFNDT